VLQSNLKGNEYTYTDDTIVLRVMKWKRCI